MEMRLEIVSLKFEVTKNREWISSLLSTTEKQGREVLAMVSEIKGSINSVKCEMESLKHRQDMVFQKQDQIQSTLSGDIPKVPNTRAYTPSDGPSIVAWSPPYVSLPMRQPSACPKIPALPLQPERRPSTDRTSSVHPFSSTPIEIETFSDEDIQSLLSLDLGGKPEDIQHSIQSVSVVDVLFPGTLQNQLATAPTSEPGAMLEPPPTSGHPASLQSHISRQVQPFGGQPGAQHAEFSSDRTLHPECSNSEESPSAIEALSRGRQAAKGDIPPDVVINAFMQKYSTLDVTNVGRLGVLLAKYSYFGDAVLEGSTLKGKGNRPGFDQNKLDQLMLVIHNKHPFSLLSLAEFQARIQPKILRALTDSLKPKKK